MKNVRSGRCWFGILLLAVLFTTAIAGSGEAEPIAPELQPQQSQATLREARPDIRQLLEEAQALIKSGKISEALTTTSRALELAGEDRAQLLAVADRAYEFGKERWELGRLAEARAFLNLSLIIRQKSDSDSLDVASSLNVLGNVAYDEGNLKSAKEYYQRALAIRSVKSPDSLDESATISNLGLLAFSEDDIAGARQAFLRALAIQSKLAPVSIPASNSLNNLGILARDAGDLRAARDYFEKSLKIREIVIPGSLQVAASLNNLGSVALAEGNLDAAESYHLRALKIREEKAPGSLDVARSLLNLGNLADSKKSPAKALELYGRALKIQSILAPESLDVADTLNNLGRISQDLRDFAAAGKYFEDSLKINQAKRPGTLAAASALSALANLEAERGNNSQARTYQGQALAIRKRVAPGSLDVAESLGALASLAYVERELASARSLYTRCLEIRMTRRATPLEIAATRVSLGAVHHDEGDLRSAETLYGQALETQRNGGADPAQLAKTLNNLGNLAGVQGRLAVARTYHENALALKIPLEPDSVSVARSLNSLGNICFSLGDIDAAGSYYERCLGIYVARAPAALEIATIYGNLGNVAQARGDLIAALAAHRKALELHQHRSPDSLEVATSLSNIAGIEYVLKRDVSGTANDLKALEIRLRKAPNSLALASSFSNLGVRALKNGKVGEAQTLFSRAVAIQQSQAPDSLTLALTLNNLGAVAEQSKKYGDSVALRSRAWRIVRQSAREVDGDEARRAYEARFQRFGWHLQQVQIAMGNPEAALRTLEEGRARALQQSLSERALKSTADPTALEEYQTAINAEHLARVRFGSALNRFQAAQLRGDGAATNSGGLKTSSSELDAARLELTRARIQAERLWARIKATSRGQALAEPMSTRSARAALARGDLFLAYSVGQDASTLFIIPGDPKQRIRIAALRLGERALQDLVLPLSQEVSDRNSSPAKVMSLGRALAERLFPPDVVAAIRSAQRVIVSPDGPLWDVPWAALPLRAAGARREELLGLAKPVVLSQSLQVYATGLTSGRTTTAPSIPALTVGGCNYRLRPTNASAAGPTPHAIQAVSELGQRYWDPLPATLPEAQGVAQLYQGVVLSGADASEANVRRQIGSAAVIHLATHGSYHPVDALLSGLILSNPGSDRALTSDTDGVLEAAEVLDPTLQLRAEIVVLSACSSGRGTTQRAEGLVGLTRCLQIAGARSVVASQWNVADRSTERFMTRFHQALREGKGKDEAIRRASLALASSEETAHPYYWAPFLLLGDPRPLGSAPLTLAANQHSYHRPYQRPNSHGTTPAKVTGRRSRYNPTRTPSRPPSTRPTRISSAAQAIRPGAGGKPVAAARPKASRMGPILPRVGTVVTASGSLWSPAGPRRTPLFAWSALTPNMSLVLDPGARAVVVLDRGGRFELAGPVTVLVRVDSLTLKAGAGGIRTDRPTPALGIGARPRRFPGRVLGGVLRGTELEFIAPTPRFGSLEGPVRLAWTSKLLNVARSVVRVKSADGKRFLFEKSVEGDTTEVELPETLPRGEWLMVTLSVRDAGKTIGEQRSWVRLATAEEKAAYEALRQQSQEQAEDSIPGLLLAERAIELGLYDAADEVLKRLAEKTSNPEVKSSLDALRKRAADELERLSAGQKGGG